MKLTADMLRRIALSTPNVNILALIVDGINTHGDRFGLDQPHRQAHYLANLALESGGFTRQTENLNYTSAQRIYDVFKGSSKSPRFRSVAECQLYVRNPEKLANKVYGNRMGNTKPGDGWLYRGRTPKQITGKSNYAAFTKWVLGIFAEAPNFVADPDAITHNPWSFLATVWFWDANDCNRYADRNDPENLRRVINGGLNGYADVLAYYDRAALVLLGYGVNEVAKFQRDNGLTADGISGPLTRAAMHQALIKLTDKPARAKTVQAAPVVEVEKVPVKLGNPEKPFWKSKEFVATTLTGGGLTGAVSAVGTIPWQNLIVLLVAAFLGLMGFLAWSHIRDRHKQDQKAEAIKS
ncbi:peptidoglycan-binding protein [Phyllobacterium sp. 0TCS1.6C]|uniref:peptidoglycan-binding protein n=1 Tax=unclassified Phyllobacterium TaxID=2638441 RepID=UPI002265112B|nr:MULTISPECIES: peptidoglycan-binding protein [unclassified Phyllobacterium]MCX8282492.1 peptidoglycan-binding protein [Phyllobacterium sp. 0TCS1.6C]MCX8292584.1 peptidoglycan-binding protein [Phyllobacterium sp. 0TCS1.6A]